MADKAGYWELAAVAGAKNEGAAAALLCGGQ